MAYADLNYYQSTYKGFIVPSNKFGYYSERATDKIDKYINKEVEVYDQAMIDYADEIKKANCAIADILHEADDKTSLQNVSSEGSSSYSVSYNNNNAKKKTTEQSIYSVMETYLADSSLLYRGLC